MEDKKNTIGYSTINFPATRHLEQITAFEVERRGLKADGVPVLFERKESFRSDPDRHFLITDADQERPRNRVLVVPDEAVAYVVGRTSTDIRSEFGDYGPKPFVYIPVQFYKQR